MTTLDMAIQVARTTEMMATVGDKTHIPVAFRPVVVAMAYSGKGKGSDIDHRWVVQQGSIAVPISRQGSGV